jgi:CHAT domain-containing protein
MVRSLAIGGSHFGWRVYGGIAAVAYALAIPSLSVGAELACNDAAPGANLQPALRLLAEADCYRSNGEVARSLDALQAALAAVEPRDSATTIAIYARVGQLQLSLGHNTAALDALSRGLDLATAPEHEDSAAGLLNDLGRAYIDADRPLDALAAFADGARLAPAGQPELAVSATINLLRALAENRPGSALGARLDAQRTAALALPASVTKVEILLALAALYREAASADSSTADRAAHAAELARSALAPADQYDDTELRADAYGELGQAYAAQGDAERALSVTREAQSIAQRAGLTGTLYRWEWQAGRLLRGLGRMAEALQAYQAAIDTLGATPIAAVTSRRAFQRDVLPLYEEYADAMLASSRGLEGAAADAVLADVQRSVERLRVAEVRNYFENQCSVPDVGSAAVAGTGALVIYPLLFPDRLEILVSTGGSLRQFTTDVRRPELARTIRLLREAIEDGESGTGYLVHAQQLYAWIIEPLHAVLEQAAPSTLVLVPDGALRTVPFAVLHDGERFLVERYALATTPALSLIGAVNLEPVSRVLVNGLSAPVQGFAALPFVTQELDSIAATMPSRVYADESFVTATLEREILAGGYSIVHMATHAQFEADYRRSFLLTYDDVITLDELEDVMGSRRFTDRPIDLLVLSACQTAVGDERAALGLAGVAVKAGARSALASLWHINDESTALLVAEFYRQLAAAEGRAAALRGAQLRLLNEPRFSHPAFWAPFLMIGDWR